jgi:hypothetical protein
MLMHYIPEVKGIEELGMMLLKKIEKLSLNFEDKLRAAGIPSE